MMHSLVSYMWCSVWLSSLSDVNTSATRQQYTTQPRLAGGKYWKNDIFYRHESLFTP